MRCRVLMIEDSAPMRMAVSRILESKCDLVGYVEDGRLAVSSALQHRPDVILLDISLPGVSGLVLLPALRSALPGATIVMLTNHVSQEYMDEAFRRGADSYVVKNESREALLPAVRRGRGSSPPAETRACGVAVA